MRLAFHDLPVEDALSRRRLLAGAAGAGLLAGCAGPAAPSRSATRTVTDGTGQVVLPAAPQRVVTLGSAETDTAVALGVVPVVASRAFGRPDGTNAWLAPALAGRPVDLVDLTEGLPLERIAAARPDVIIAPSFQELDANREALRRIAPVVGFLKAPFVDTWQEQALLVGQTLGLEDRARSLIGRVEGDLAARGAAHPGWKGRTLTYGVHFDPTATRVFGAQQDKSMAIFTGTFGLSTTPALQALADPAVRAGTVDVGPERLDLLEADALLLTYVTPELQRQFEADPLFQRLDVVRRGAYVAVDRAAGGALREPSVLSLPYAVEELEKALVQALG